ncbi:MAG: QueT transporter family protein [Clostridiales bacterium]|nr:QueT transporter family protein [Clostridiales bacterium]
MEHKNLNNVQKLTISGIVIALYVVILFMTQSFSFGAYQIRIVTTMYALSYLFPFLVIPLGLANFIANMIGGLGLVDMVGGCIVGIVTSFLIVLIRKFHLNRALIFFPIMLVPGLGVALWLSPLLNFPYPALAVNLCIGQSVPAVCGVILTKVLERVFRNGNIIMTRSETNE